MKYWVYLFGSTARNENDNESDLDILILLNDVSNFNTLKSEIEKIITVIYRKNPSFSMYSIDRIKEYYNEGTLFAWHLFYESTFLFSNTNEDILKNFEEPQKYKKHKEEFELFLWLIYSIKKDIDYISKTYVLEVSNFYIACRNIGIILSNIITEKPYFSPYSIYKIDKNFPIDIVNFQKYRKIKSQKSTNISIGYDYRDYLEFIKDIKKIELWLKNIEEEYIAVK